MITLKTKLLVPVTVLALTLAGLAAGARAAGDKKTDAPAADAKKIDIAITEKGFEPATIDVKKGQPVELVFTRKTDHTCIKEVVLDTGSSKVQKPLPLNTPVAIKTKFAKPGTYVCGMNMFSGTVKVQ
ncbi:MAG TPA: cupredoxin domain-containing protein [Polyangia bacterium]|nr:cupredoxin domain-containing protein [Polyangia bacterium]